MLQLDIPRFDERDLEAMEVEVGKAP